MAPATLAAICLLAAPACGAALLPGETARDPDAFNGVLAAVGFAVLAMSFWRRGARIAGRQAAPARFADQKPPFAKMEPSFVKGEPSFANREKEARQSI
jgi:hypothetical protein